MDNKMIPLSEVERYLDSEGTSARNCRNYAIANALSDAAEHFRSLASSPPPTPAVADEVSEREAFATAELKAFEQHFANLGLEFEKYPPNMAGAIYIQAETSCLWRGWQASARIVRTAPIADPVPVGEPVEADVVERVALAIRQAAYETRRFTNQESLACAKAAIRAMPPAPKPTLESERAALVQEVGECCQAADPLCSEGCLVEKALRKRAYMPPAPRQGVLEREEREAVEQIIGRAALAEVEKHYTLIPKHPNPSLA